MKTALALISVLCAAQLAHARSVAVEPDYSLAAADPNYAEPLWRRPAFNNPPTPLPNTVKPVADPEPRTDADHPSRCPPLPLLKENASRLEGRIWTLTIIELYAQCAASKQ